MKRIVVLLIVAVLMLPAVALAANVDLSGMSFDELVALKQRINLALWSADEWQEVTVPQGVYEIGVDIPAGHWTIKAADGQHIMVCWGTALDESGTGISCGAEDSFYIVDFVTSETSDYFEQDDKLQLDYDLKEGQYFVIDRGYAVFSPFSGKPDLGFK
jgi:hypothetical protein